MSILSGSIKQGFTVVGNLGNEIDATTAATDICMATITATADAHRTALPKTTRSANAGPGGGTAIYGL